MSIVATASKVPTQKTEPVVATVKDQSVVNGKTAVVAVMPVTVVVPKITAVWAVSKVTPKGDVDGRVLSMSSTLTSNQRLSKLHGTIRNRDVVRMQHNAIKQALIAHF